MIACRMLRLKSASGAADRSSSPRARPGGHRAAAAHPSVNCITSLAAILDHPGTRDTAENPVGKLQANVQASICSLSVCGWQSHSIAGLCSKRGMGMELIEAAMDGDLTAVKTAIAGGAHADYQVRTHRQRLSERVKTLHVVGLG